MKPMFQVSIQFAVNDVNSLIQVLFFALHVNSGVIRIEVRLQLDKQRFHVFTVETEEQRTQDEALGNSQN